MTNDAKPPDDQPRPEAPPDMNWIELATVRRPDELVGKMLQVCVTQDGLVLARWGKRPVPADIAPQVMPLVMQAREGAITRLLNLTVVMDVLGEQARQAAAKPKIEVARVMPLVPGKQ